MFSLSNLAFVGRVGASSAPAPNPLAYVSSSGNDGTAQLDDAAHPFQTISAAGAALVAAFYNQPTTIVLQSNLTTLPESFPSEIYVGGATLTLDGGGHILSYLTMPVPPVGVPVDFTLKDITVSQASVSAGVDLGGTTTTFGTIRHVGTVTASFNFSEPGTPQAATGDQGYSLPDGVGATGSTGSPGSPNGGTGGVGESFFLTGGTGNPGSNGRGAWSCTLDIGDDAIAVSHPDITGQGCQGGNGGNGGGNSTGLYGGTGGTGGDGQDDGMGNPANGGDGGNGGDCWLTGGDGGTGGNGGDGSVITYTGSNKGTVLTTGTTNLTAGMAGFGGNGGSAIAWPGSGGSGGNGYNGGANGNSGGTGGYNSFNGNMGMGGNDGAAGYVVP